MAKKIRLGLNLFFTNSSNSGVVNYIYNIIYALNTLPEKNKPAIVVYHSVDAPIEYLREINYPDIKFLLFKHNSSFKIIRGINKLFKKILKKDLYHKLHYFNKIDVLYPYFEFRDKEFNQIKNKIHWLVDFNNCAYPSHYADGGNVMAEYQKILTQRTDHLVLSSQSLQEELKLYYPDYKNKVSILRFASALPNLGLINIKQLLDKYNLKKPYFMSPNQFWEHKNQIVVIEALNILKTSGKLNFQVVFTGSMDVNRGKGHILTILLEAIKQYKLEDTVKFLGIIDRHEQLALMNNATALIQPSFYEGWSTLVEEAKAMNQKIILSDLPVHKEQNCINSYFFNPLSAKELADQIALANSNTIPIRKIDYSKNIAEFGKTILTILANELEEK